MIKRTMAQSIFETLNRLKRAYIQYQDSGGEAMRYTVQGETARYKKLMDASARLLDAETITRMRAIYKADLEQAYELGESATNSLIDTVEDPDNVQDELTEMPTVAQTVAGQRLTAFWDKERVQLRDKVTQATLRALQQGKGWKAAQRDIAMSLRTSGQSILTANDELSVTARNGIVMNLEQRANMVARTELASAYVQGQMKQYKQNGFQYGRWSATGERSCAFCVSREGVIYEIDEIEAAIPAHPRCRCTIAPVTNEAVEAWRNSASEEIGAAEFLDDGGWTAIRQQRFDEWMKYTGNTKLDAAKWLAKPTSSEKFFKGPDATPATPVRIPSGSAQPKLGKAAASTAAVEGKPGISKAEERNLKSEERELKAAEKGKQQTQKELGGNTDGLTKAERAYLGLKADKGFRSDKAIREEMIRRGHITATDDPQGRLIKIARNARIKTNSADASESYVQFNPDPES